MAQLAAAAVEDKLQEVMQSVEQEAADPLLGKWLDEFTASSRQEQRAQLQAKLQTHLDMLLSKHVKLASWIITDAQATAVARSPYDELVVGKNFRYREWFNGVKELPPDTSEAIAARSTLGISPAFQSVSRGNPIWMNISAPIKSPVIKDKNGQAKTIGVMGSTIRLSTFNEWLAIAEEENSSRGIGCPDSFVLLTYRNQLLRHPCPYPHSQSLPIPPEKMLQHPPYKNLVESPLETSSQFQDLLRQNPDGSSITSLAVARSLKTLTNWRVVIVQDVDAALRPMVALSKDFKRPAKLALGAGGVASVLLIGLLWWGERKRIARPKS